MSDPESMCAPSDWKTTLVIGGFFTALAAGPPLIAWWTDQPAWLWGWVILLILGLAG